MFLVKTQIQSANYPAKVGIVLTQCQIFEYKGTYLKYLLQGSVCQLSCVSH